MINLTGCNIDGGVLIGPQYLDPYYSQVVLLLNFDGTNGSQTIVDQSQYADATGVCVGTSALSTAQTLFGSTTLALNGTNNAGVQFNDSSRFTLGSGEFCIEMFSRPQISAVGAGWLCAQGPADLSVNNSSFRIYTDWSGGLIRFTGGRCIGANYFPGAISSGYYPPDNWYHVAFYRVGSNTYLAVNGVIVGSNLGNTNPANDSTSKLAVGCLGESTSFQTPVGYMGPFRMTVGAGRYPETNFTPPSGPFPA